MNKQIALVFFSSDRDFAQLHKRLLETNIKTKLLISESPKPQGRDHNILPNPAHLAAQEARIPVLTPERLDEEFEDKLDTIITRLKKSFEVVGFVFAYGKIIPPQIIDLFDGKLLNLHPSLLPKYRGASPIQSAILDSKKKTGYSIIKINEKVDSGDILFQDELEVLPNDDYSTLRKRIVLSSGKKIPEIINNYVAGKIVPEKQNDKLATYTKLIKKEDAQLTVKDTAKSAYRKILAYASWPKAFFIIKQKRIIIHQAEMQNGYLLIRSVQPEGKKVLTDKEFLNGYSNLLTCFPDYAKFSQ